MIDSDLSEQFDDDLLTTHDTSPHEISADDTAISYASSDTTPTPVSDDLYDGRPRSRLQPIAIPGTLSIAASRDGIVSSSHYRDTSINTNSLEPSGLEPSIFTHHYFMERLRMELELRALEEEQFNSVLLESRDEFDATDMIEKNESTVLNSTPQKYSTVKIKKKREELCCICIENFSCNHEVHWLSCTHIFHKECLDEWVKYKNECPTCRSQLDIK